MAEKLAAIFDLDASRGFRGIESRFADFSSAKKALRHADASDFQRLQALGLEPASDDELGRAASDVDDQPRRRRCRQHVRNADVDQPRFLVPANHVDGRSKRPFGAGQEVRHVGRDAKRVCRHRTHRRRVHARQALAKSREACERGSYRFGPDAAVGAETRTEAQRFAPRVLTVDLVSLDASDLQTEAVRSEIDNGEGRRGHDVHVRRGIAA